MRNSSLHPYYEDESVTIYNMDCREFDGSADVIVTDPPYGLSFMDKAWDSALPDYWHFDAGWLFAFGGTRTWHRLACAIEDAGWQIRDTVMWLYGQGFPKGKNNLKPAWEPIIVARKYGDLDIDAARIGVEGGTTRSCQAPFQHESVKGRVHATRGYRVGHDIVSLDKGRWPANLILDEEVGAMLDEQSGESISTGGQSSLGAFRNGDVYGKGKDIRWKANPGLGDSGGASRFFYCAKASRSERGEGNDHPTVKPLKLMEYLITLSGGQAILDPFCGSGTTLVAAKRLGRKAIGIDTDEHSCEIAARRCRQVLL